MRRRRRPARPAAAGALALGVALAAVPQAHAADRNLTRMRGLGKPHAVLSGVAPRAWRGGYIAKVVVPVRARTRPNGSRSVWRIRPWTMYTGNATRLMVLAARFDRDGIPWLKVQLPIRPNRTSGWIPADDTLLRHTPWFVRVRVRSREVEVYRSGRRVKRTRAVVGAPATPTPRGQFAIYEEAPRPHGDFLGPWALHLTAFSDVLTNYGGGPGRVAIHGRGPESRREAALGTAASHGCVRIDNGPIRWMQRHLAPGTPVRITG